MSDANSILKLITELVVLAHETEWVEFKHNKAVPDEIGKYLSALANSAALHNQPRGYLVWGIEDETHHMVGTKFRPSVAKVGNEPLENWLATHLHPRIHFVIREVDESGNHFVLVEVSAASHTPVRFKDLEYVRVGSVTKRLRDHPEKERVLWSSFSQSRFEDGIAYKSATADDVLKLIDYPAYFEMTDQSLPERGGILDRLVQERFIIPRDGGYDITSLGAILFARDIRNFGALARKSIRVVFYDGPNRAGTIREQEGRKGYASGFVGLVEYINSQLPTNELIEQALRKQVPVYPEIAVRELVANALIHQDFTVTGSGPMIELFSDRMEITNPGKPLIDPQRFLGSPPRSRNEMLASFLRRIGVCEERGSGIIKVITSIEVFQLPAPDFMEVEGFTRVVLYAPQTLADMDRRGRVRACYQHAGLEVLSNRQMTNASLRRRFGISEENAAQASRIIRETLDAKLIREYDPANRSKRHSRYVPFWA